MDMSLNFSAFVDGLSVFLIGVVMVFIVLFLLILLIKLVGWAVGTMESKKNQAMPVNQPVVNENLQKEDVTTQLVDDLELIAVITATIAASLETTSDKLQVRSLRKVNRA